LLKKSTLLQKIQRAAPIAAVWLHFECGLSSLKFWVQEASEASGWFGASIALVEGVRRAGTNKLKFKI
jgi:hypothetical protein